MTTPREALEVVAQWLDAFYGPVEDYGDGELFMTQLDHGHEEHQARIAVAIAVREALASYADAGVQYPGILGRYVR